jgi:hypothetical protein
MLKPELNVRARYISGILLVSVLIVLFMLLIVLFPFPSASANIISGENTEIKTQATIELSFARYASVVE